MDIVVALIGAVATIAAAVISVRANRPASSAPAGSATAALVVSGVAPHEPATSRAAGLGAAAARIAGALAAFVLSALALATLINVVHDLDTGASSSTDAAVIIGLVVLVAAVAVLWNLARLLLRPVGARSSLRSTLLLAVNIVAYGGTLAMMAGLWQR